MQNRTDLVGVSLWERGKHLLRSHQEVTQQLGAFIAGFFMAGSCILGGISPFGVAFCAAVSARCAVTAAAGAILGYTFSPMADGSMKYIVAVLMALAARWLFGPKALPKYQVAVAATIASFSLAVANAAILVLADATLYDVVMCMAELFLVCGATYFFSRALGCLDRGLNSWGRSDLSCIAIALAVTLMGISSIQIAGFSLGRILAVVAVLLCARYLREAGGAIAGVTAGVALGLAGGDYSFLLITSGLGGLVAGVFGGMGRVATAASYIFINTIVALFTLEYAAVYTSILEVFAATVLFVALPQSLASRLGTLHHIGSIPDNTTQKALCERVEDISGALKEICATTQQVSERLGKMEGSGFSNVYTRVAEQVCMRCGSKTACWQFKYSDTVASMNQCITQLKREGSITKAQVPKRFQDTCCKLDEFTAALNAQFHDYVAREGVQRKVSKVRGVVTDQFEGIALMLDEIAGEMGNLKLMDPQKNRAVEEYFEKQGITARQVICYTDEFDRISLEVQIPGYQAAKLHKSRSALDLCTILEADFDIPGVTAREKYTSVLYTEKAALTVSIGAHQIAAGAGRLCGDAYDYIRNKNGKCHFIISDGMGSGGSAAVDSAMASGLISRLISVGIGYEAALKMVNSALLIKSGEESLATIDICSLDLFTGKAEFYKAGAAPTYVVKNGKAGYIESTSLPAGILRGVAFEKSSLTLHEGDLILMVSDGVIATGADWIKSELENHAAFDVQALCEKITATAKLRRVDGREDDITAVAALVQRGT